MPIDPKILQSKPVSKHAGHDVRKGPASKLGVHGTKVAVDQDLCIGCGACAQTCPVKVYELIDVTGAKKSDPVREKECITCRACEAVCPARCISVKP